VNILKQLRFNTDESLFGMFDGGHNSHVPQLCVKRMPEVLRDAMMHHDAPSDFMKYAMLAMHRSVLIVRSTRDKRLSFPRCCAMR